MTTSSWDDYLAPDGDDPLPVAAARTVSSSERQPTSSAGVVHLQVPSSASGWGDWTAATGDGWADSAEGRIADGWEDSAGGRAADGWVGSAEGRIADAGQPAA